MQWHVNVDFFVGTDALKINMLNATTGWIALQVSDNRRLNRSVDGDVEDLRIKRFNLRCFKISLPDRVIFVVRLYRHK